MTTFVSVKSYKTYLSKIKKNLVFESNELDKKTASKMRKTIKKLAPQNSGQTKQGIITRKFKKGYRVISSVPGRFKQNLFANRTKPYRTLSFGKKNRFYKQGQTVTYGKAALSRSGKPIKFTGTPAFFDVGVRSEVPKYRNQLKKLNSRAINKAKI